MSDGSWIRRLRMSLALLVIAIVYFYRLDKPLLWGDEAETGIVARNILRSGYPVAYDNRNVTITKSGAQLNASLTFKKIPWLQYYVGAISITIFGNNTAGLRLMFTALGLVSFFPIYSVLAGRVKCPEAIAALALIAPQVLLFQRNARYYSILILLYASLVWLISVEFKSAKIRFWIATLLLVLFFHAHPLAAACSSASLILYCLIFERKSILLYALSSVIGFLSWFVWYESLGPPLAKTSLSLWKITTDFSLWFNHFVTGAVVTFVDLDAVDCLPILLWLVLVPLLIWRGRTIALACFSKPIPTFVLLNILIQVMATAAVFGYETQSKFGMLRYMPHLIVLAIVSSFVLLDSLIARQSLYLLACTFVMAFNLLTLSYWTHPYSRSVPVSWVKPVYLEMFQARESVWDRLVNEFRNQPQSSSNNDSRILALPEGTRDVLNFYLGDRFLVPPYVDDKSLACVDAIRQKLGDQAYRRLSGPADWFVDLRGLNEHGPEGYEVHAVFPSNQNKPYDGNRPELTRHTFLQDEVVTQATCYRLQKKP